MIHFRHQFVLVSYSTCYSNNNIENFKLSYVCRRAVVSVYVQLGKMRYATVSEFRGRKMVNIREYYEADGELRPGKKGQYVKQMDAVYSCLYGL